MGWKQTITVDSTAYPLCVAQRAAYALADKLSILISPDGSSLALEITPALIAGGDDSLPSVSDARELVLRNLNDFALREQIQRETSGLRELLASAALRGAGV
ncbi:His-Xaa-Ser system protein HxsD [Pseudomonas gingeri]|nr:His-Xaa-Ser system protein HxsD [Pseudomonas gingeri]NVZ75819.1 His-Xaa-Ser system protein HxsD [Pseudomonas gingeri]NWD09675.1 His-Xaa-Ser system protein HxsD [Pseudomonas gingeri]NWE36792.1 His-Xaa-Ser system protein HxsD [Pseudomonas gingeri]NWE61136.1 His-Xaa-Ser system protein HxsD [Pseudomonas gingeri]